MSNLIFIPINKMTNQEAQMLAFQDLQEIMVDLGKLRKKLAVYSLESIDHINYRGVQDVYLKLKQPETAVTDRRQDWKEEAGFEYSPVKFKKEMDSLTKVFIAADLAMAEFVVSLTKVEHFL